MARGLFITFEGGEGCGKSTQIRLLEKRLRLANYEVVVTREPGGTAIGEHLRNLLQFSKAGHAMAPETELLLFTASRAQLVRELIQPALATDALVLADRFLDSTTVYQGVARRLDSSEVATINCFAVGGCIPDLTLIFDLDPTIARNRMQQRPEASDDRMEQQPAEFYEAVRDGYRHLAANDSRFRLVDASKPIEDMEIEVWRAVAPLLTR